MTFVLAITGPTGAGKSQVARILSTTIPECANIEVDHVKKFLVSAYRYEEPSGLDQWRLLGSNLGMLAANYEAAAYNVIINGFLTTEAWHELEKHVNLTRRVLLLPSIEANLVRNIIRAWEDQLEDEDVRKHQAYFRDKPMFRNFTAIDSTDQTVAETVEAVRDLLPLA